MWKRNLEGGVIGGIIGFVIGAMIGAFMFYNAHPEYLPPTQKNTEIVYTETIDGVRQTMYVDNTTGYVYLQTRYNGAASTIQVMDENGEPMKGKVIHE